jgi:16S rRNA (cytidine1402-2'-O)-methyltransferase
VVGAQKPAGSPGQLLVVATPIGNLGDMSPRAREALADADLIAAEDTRRTQQLLNVLGLAKPLVSLHSHNEKSRTPELVEKMLNGAHLALVSDAGTPLLSDPGAGLVAAALQAGIDVRPIPGPTAIATLLSASGVPTERFAFEGFLPAKSSARRAELATLVRESRTLVFFEAPHRLVDTLADLRDVLGPERRACVGRELTKLHETLYRGTLGELAALSTQDRDMLRGEASIAVAGADGGALANSESNEVLERSIVVLAKQLPPGRAASAIAEIFGLPRRLAYSRVLAASEKH